MRLLALTVLVGVLSACAKQDSPEEDNAHTVAVYKTVNHCKPKHIDLESRTIPGRYGNEYVVNTNTVTWHCDGDYEFTEQLER